MSDEDQKVPAAVLKRSEDLIAWTARVKKAFAEWQTGGHGRDGGEGCGTECVGCLIGVIAEAKKGLDEINGGDGTAAWLEGIEARQVARSTMFPIDVPQALADKLRAKR